MSFERKTIDDIARLLTNLTGEERLVGRDDSGDFKATTLTLVQYVAGQIASISYSVKEIDDADYTITDIDAFGCYIFKNLTADRTLTFPTLADNNNKKFTVINASGSYDVDCTPEDRGSGDIDYINDWKLPFPITEKGGEIEFKGLSDKWSATPLNDACIYETRTESTIILTTTLATWEDVITLSINAGNYDLRAEMLHYFVNSSIADNVSLFSGISTVTGNSAPDIKQVEYAFNCLNDDIESVEINQISEVEDYETASSITLRLKSYYNSDETATSHSALASAVRPILLRAIRKY